MTKRAEIILPLAFVLALNKILLSLNQSHALIALLTGGLKKRTLLRPCFMVALLLAAFLLYNFQIVIPKALPYLESFEKQNFRKKEQQDYQATSAYHLTLQDQEHLLFGRYDATTHTLYDVYYLPSLGDIWKIKHLVHNTSGCLGYHIDHFVRNDQGNLYKEGSYQQYLFPELTIDPMSHLSTVALVEQMSLSELYLLTKKSPAKIAQSAKAHLVFKLLSPFLSCLLIMSCAPFCMNFSRKLPIFLIYAISIFGVISFFIITDSAIILCENNNMNPIIIISLPFLLCITGFWVKFKKACLVS